MGKREGFFPPQVLWDEILTRFLTVHAVKHHKDSHKNQPNYF